ncbi:MAG: 3'-5' exonuclease [Opitutaceae bacterium]
MNTILFLDFETSGLPRKGEGFPRAVSIAWGIAGTDNGIVDLQYHVIRPDGFTISAEATAVHGISQRKALEVGIGIRSIVDQLEAVLNRYRPSQLVAHNLNFDLHVISHECKRMNRACPIEGLSEFCTMKHSTELCAIPGSRGGYKWPKLEELYQFLFGRNVAGAHNALIDVCATIECYQELSKRGRIGDGVPLRQIGNINQFLARRQCHP